MPRPPAARRPSVRRRARARLAALLLVAGCAGARPAADAAGALADVWAGLDGAAASLDGRVPDACDGPFGTWFTTFGVRGLACLAAETAAPAALAARAPAAPFRSGPHAVTAAGVALDLSAGRAFGHYDPAFVRWLGAAAVPSDPAARTLVRPAYRRHAARLARVYWLARRSLLQDGYPGATPAGPVADYAAYLGGAAAPPSGADGRGGFSVFAFTERSERLLPTVGLASPNDWEVRYELNTATGFWLRRRADGTQEAWAGALRGLLVAFDADWLRANGG